MDTEAVKDVLWRLWRVDFTSDKIAHLRLELAKWQVEYDKANEELGEIEQQEGWKGA